ncbi:hypothetical protein CDAR_243631 [Caerostris darwini]|uniref:Type II toxin-antitoxin system RelE/ParE family toxin n=1 Tax=Caerostris darwini TaxID=1538125 RepID=A0AAV4VCG0_9ARAC|nr:hypothetical protein CDAR_243631 [Caerostris darwini]
MMYTIITEKKYQRGKRAKGFPKRYLPEIEEYVACLEDNPFQVRNAKKLAGGCSMYRKRFGSWRLIYSVDKKTRTVVLSDLCIRSEGTYRR